MPLCDNGSYKLPSVNAAELQIRQNGGSQNLLFFNVHLELFKNADALFDVWVSAEEIAKTIEKILGQFLRANDEELSHIFTVNVTKSRVFAYLAKGTCKCKRIATKFRTSCISHELTLATDCKASKESEKISYSTAYDSHNKHNQHTTILIVA